MTRPPALLSVLLAGLLLAAPARADIHYDTAQFAGAPVDRGRDLVHADFDSNGVQDIAVANCGSTCGGTGTGDVRPFTNISLGSISYSPGAALTAGTGPTELVAGDFNRDGDPDLVSWSSGTDQLHFFAGAAGSTFARASSSCRPTTAPARSQPWTRPASPRS